MNSQKFIHYETYTTHSSIILSSFLDYLDRKSFLKLKALREMLKVDEIDENSRIGDSILESYESKKI